MLILETVILISANELDISQIVINTAFPKTAILEIIIFISANEIDVSQIVINTSFSKMQFLK